MCVPTEVSMSLMPRAMESGTASPFAVACRSDVAWTCTTHRCGRAASKRRPGRTIMRGPTVPGGLTGQHVDHGHPHDEVAPRLRSASGTASSEEAPQVHRRTDGHQAQEGELDGGAVGGAHLHLVLHGDNDDAVAARRLRPPGVNRRPVVWPPGTETPPGSWPIMTPCSDSGHRWSWRTPNRL